MGGTKEEDTFAGGGVSGGFGGEKNELGHTMLRDRVICRRRRQRARSRSIRHACRLLSEGLEVLWKEKGKVESWVTDGAMIIRAPGWGIGEMSLIEEGTASSQLCSCLERVGPSSVYQEPAWLASRVVIALGS